MDIAKMCLCLLSVTLLLLSSTENSFVTPLPAEETYQAKRKGGARRMMIYMPPSFSGRASGRGRGWTMSTKP
uniref:Uncharacterized protein n=1 Tax=Brassica campestris TaxID=3711 RepID=A0A3P6BIS0_BRACM|nr:unnamed protein product [Brassica rapa]